MNLEKYEFNIDIIEFLGYIISPNKVVIKTSRVTIIRDWLILKSIKEV